MESVKEVLDRNQAIYDKIKGDSKCWMNAVGDADAFVERHLELEEYVQSCIRQELLNS